MPTDDTPEEDKWLDENREKTRSAPLHKHEWEYLGVGIKRGDPTMAVIDFYCKWCIKIRRTYKDQSEMNLQFGEDSTDYRDV